MPSEPQIKLLPYKHRQQFFGVLVLVFLILLPVIIFYTTGHRISFDNPEGRIVTTGGIYVTTNDLDVDVYLDEEQVERPRLFRSAYYIQNVAAGQRRVVVQKEGLATWVKELPVDPYIVVEASAFNVPIEPQIRLITEYVTSDGLPVIFADSDDELVFEKATTTDPYIVSTSSLAQYIQNAEYDFVEGLFSTSTATSSSVFSMILREVDRFRFSTTTIDGATTTPYLEKGDMRLMQRNNELVAVWNGPAVNTPFYFCVTDTDASTTEKRYGAHVARQVMEQRLSTTTPVVAVGNHLCRQSIQIDRKRQNVYYYDFFPRTVDLVLLHLEDGLYVTEIDDRSWQNTQLMYPGTDFRVLVDNNTIYIEEKGLYFQLLTEIEE